MGFREPQIKISRGVTVYTRDNSLLDSERIVKEKEHAIWQDHEDRHDKSLLKEVLDRHIMIKSRESVRTSPDISKPGTGQGLSKPDTPKGSNPGSIASLPPVSPITKSRPHSEGLTGDSVISLNSGK